MAPGNGYSLLSLKDEKIVHIFGKVYFTNSNVDGFCHFKINYNILENVIENLLNILFL